MFSFELLSLFIVSEAIKLFFGRLTKKYFFDVKAH